MKLKKVFSITALLLVVVLGSCTKNSPSHLASPALSSTASKLQQRVAKVNAEPADSVGLLSKSEATDVSPSDTTGNVATRPITRAATQLVQGLAQVKELARLKR